MSLKASNSYQKAFILSLFIIVLGSALLKFPADDGLRHIGLAFGNLTSWGDVYPFSRFEEFRDYNPWFGYDIMLHWVSVLMKQLPFPLLATQLLLIKILPILFGSVLFHLVLSTSGLLKEIRDPHSLTLTVMLILAFLIIVFNRSLLMRPFILGTFFLLYSIRQKGMMRGIISAAALSFFYPYLSWFYIIPVAFAHFVKGDKKFALGLILFMIPFMLFQPESFWGFQIALFQSDMVRNSIDYKIREFFPTFKHWHFIVCLLALAVTYPKFSENSRQLNYINLLVLIYLWPALKYIRYFEDLLCPLLFVGFGNEILHIIMQPYTNMIQSWQAIIQKGMNRINSARIRIFPPKTKDKSVSHIKTKLWPVIAVFYTFFGVFIAHHVQDQFRDLRSFRRQLDPVPAKAILIHTFNLQYKILLLRPDLRLLPSCEMGFATKNIMPEYLQFMNEGLVTPLSKKIGAIYFLESKRFYIHPKEGVSLELISENKNLKLWRIIG